MPVYTPRGLKIRFDPLYTFALLGRLEPEAPPTLVLKTTETLELLPGGLALIGATVAVALDQPPVVIALTTFGAHLAGTLTTTFGLFVVPGLLYVGRFVWRFGRFGFLLACFAAFAVLHSGWEALGAFVVGRLAAIPAAWLVEALRAKHYMRTVGHPLLGSEVNFLNAYRLHAFDLGRSTDIVVEDDERAERGADALERFAREYPHLVEFSGY